jgi:copper oxidase (laccase) domain-containing protein
VADGFDGIVVGYQLHGCSIEMHPSQFQGILIKPGQDGHITQLSGVLLAVTVADCVPVYLAHPQSATLGLLHVGWRGAAGGMVESGIERVCSAAGVAPANVLMHCGVCICGECYEVGPEVIKEVNGRAVSGPTLLDLRSNLVERAATCGVEDVTVSDWCTAHHAERFYSHRASGGEAGRMIAYLGRPST